MPFCPECGARVTEDQKYCEQCGAELIQVQSTPRQAIPASQDSKSISPDKKSLFDPSRNYYIIKEKMWDLGFGSIYDEKGEEIGRMNRIIFSIRRRVELQELDGTVVATIHSKLFSARSAQDLKDPSGRLIARIKRKILTFFRNVFFLEDPQGRRWYTAEGDFMGWSFKVYELPSRMLVAEIEKSDRWRDIFLGGIFDFSDTYALKILEPNTDRRILVGFVLAIDNVLHDTGGFGPGRMIYGPRTPGRFPGPFGRRFPRRHF